MQQTANFNIDYTDGTDPMNLQAITAAMATSVDDALVDITDVRQIQSFTVADSAELSALVGMNAGDIAYQQDTGVTYQYNGSAWENMLDKDTGWINVTGFVNSWSSGADEFTARYRRKNGIVYLRGRVQGGTATQPAFVLPPGFRVLATSAFVCSGSSTTTFYRVLTSDNGNVAPQVSATINLENISFPADA